MKNSARLLCLMALILSFSSCSDKIVGKWKISRYEKGTPGNENVKVSNIGTMRFKKDKTGEKEITVGIFGNETNSLSYFTWDATDSYVTIRGGDLEFAKTWIRVENKRKVQLLKSTNGANVVQVLELKK